MNAPSATYRFLVFGDLHGRILPAFRFASYWSQRTGCALDGLLQVGDLGYFPDLSRMDKATIRHAQDDPLELGALDVATRTPLADQVLEGDAGCTCPLWFTAGNHEDFAELEREAQLSRSADFAVDAYARVRGIQDGKVLSLPGRMKVAAVWGIDGVGPNIRRGLPSRAYIDEGAVDQLTIEKFDVLLTHDSPRDTKRAGSGSESLRAMIELTRPRLAFFGHHHGDGASAGVIGRTQLFHLTGFELRTRGGHPERGSVGILTWTGDATFEYVPDEELKPFTRHNWQWAT